MSPRRRRRLFSMWMVFRYCPFVLCVFSVLFLETWLKIETLANDYRASAISGQARMAAERIDALKAHEAALKRMTVFDEKAPDLGLVAPAPHQLKTIYVSRNDLDSVFETEYQMARLETRERAGRGTYENPHD